MKFDNMTCRECNDKLVDYDWLGDVEKIAVDAHLRECEHCRESAAMLKSLEEVFSMKDQPEIDLADSIMQEIGMTERTQVWRLPVLSVLCAIITFEIILVVLLQTSPGSVLQMSPDFFTELSEETSQLSADIFDPVLVTSESIFSSGFHLPSMLSLSMVLMLAALFAGINVLFFLHHGPRKHHDKKQ